MEATFARPLLEVSNLKTVFPTENGVVNAVNDVSFSIERGKTVGIVGESGCGKSITGLSLLQLVPHPGRIVNGKILFYQDETDEPLDIATVSQWSKLMRDIRGNEIAIIFQEPMTSLNPVYTVGDQIAEAIVLHQEQNRSLLQQFGLQTTPKWARELAIEMLVRVGIPAPEQRFNEYPHQLSGGMRQRVMIAIALCCAPALLIADEPTTALDVTIQAQVLALMRELQTEIGMAIMLITHDLGVIADMADEVVVMYAGRVVEKGNVDDIFYNPLHPYTRGLLNSIPSLRGSQQDTLPSISGTVPHPLDLPVGCSFQPRCSERMQMCEQMPELNLINYTEDNNLRNGKHAARCWLSEESVNGETA
ncbi:ABC transporter ATP-binding protein [Candidatus Poribacteria bacterium]|nr:ABC transporter ATP-binding protein [Candidatus Poribacteria bacterium]MYB65647.1 ABC transporter ATP-binding protein [Candidatus Poribacteria bacterium]MYF55831.1 ABC transporter ATP-binding protein [Candidatus Poribacteria bacterium]